MIWSNFKVIYSFFAVKDFAEAVSFYNKHQKGLGKKFKTAIQKKVSEIIANPAHTSVRYKNVRTAACETFPYAIHYVIDTENETIFITAIFHFSRNPDW